MRLKGKTALVTGAASGIGKATAERFAEEGCTVVCADKNGNGATATAKGIKDADGQAFAVTLDVTNADQVNTVIAEAVDQTGGLDIVVNNAGITIVGSVEQLSEAQWDTEMDINLNTASIAGQIGIAQDAAYCASKAAVIMLTRCMAKDGAGDKIRVNCVCPGFIDTPMIQGYFDDQDDPAAARAFATGLHPLGRLGFARDIANGFLYLASDDAEWVTGTALTVDGGLMAALPG